MNQPNISDYETDNNSQPDSLLNGQTGVSLDATSENNDGNGLEFVFNFADNVPQEIRDNINKAGEAWSEVITDDVTVEIDIGFEPETNSLANASSEKVEVSYSEFRQALSDSATSENDAIAVANLPEDDTVNLLINNTKENQGSDDVYLDDNGSENNSTIAVNRSTAEALGLDVGEDVADATITFDQGVNWDYDASDGVAVNAVDFESVATHEIGHVLGFNASVDDLDEVAGQNLKELIASGDVGLEDIAQALGIEVEDLTGLLEEFGLENIEAIDLENFEESIAGTPIEPILESIQPDLFTSEDNYTLSSMDLFRYSDLSSDLGVIDFTTGESEKYFSLDGGNTEIAQFSTGEFLGDGRQTSHWKDNLGIGIMDPTFNTAEIGNISQNDLQLLDAIGWDVVA
jgi:hypothetical protein